MRVLVVAAILALTVGMVTSCKSPVATVVLSTEPASLTTAPTREPTPSPTAAPTVTPTPAQPPAHASPGDTWVRPNDGAVMVYIPAGEFPYGPGSTVDPPKQCVYLETFWIDQTEVTNAQFARCVAAGGCDEPLFKVPYRDPARADHPVIQISYGEATAFCTWAGARLPAEIEWEKAGRGTDGRMFPWGDTLDVTRANYYRSGFGGTRPVGSYPDGASPYGVLDMTGNVCEWVQELWRADEDYLKNPFLPPGIRPSGKHPIGHHYTLRGGSWADLEDWLPIYSRTNEEPGWRTKDIGFRCACSVEGSP